MGYTTDFIGHIDIEPALNEHEQAYLAAFATSRRSDLRDGPYDSPGNPAAEAHTVATATMTPDQKRSDNSVVAGQPGLWCGWAPSWAGGCLTHDGVEKFYRPVEWMEYLIEHFLRPGALAESSGLAFFEHFTFDHHLDGTVAGNRRDTREMFLIDVEDNIVSKTVLRRGYPLDWEYDLLPYEAALKDSLSRRVRPRPRLRTIDRPIAK